MIILILLLRILIYLKKKVTIFLFSKKKYDLYFSQRIAVSKSILINQKVFNKYYLFIIINIVIKLYIKTFYLVFANGVRFKDLNLD